MRLDVRQWDIGYGMAWKKCRGQLVGPMPTDRGLSFDAGAAQAFDDYDRTLRAREAGIRPPGELRPMHAGR